MPAARYWRIVGIETYAGGDLELSELHLLDSSGVRLDAAATLTCSHAPVSGVLATLQSAGTSEVVRFASGAVRSAGFYIAWDAGATAVDVAALRLGSGDVAETFAGWLNLEYFEAGRWKGSGSVDWTTWPGPRTYAYVTPSPGYRKKIVTANFEGVNGSANIVNDVAGGLGLSAYGGAALSTEHAAAGSSSLRVWGKDSGVVTSAPPIQTAQKFILSVSFYIATDAPSDWYMAICGQGAGQAFGEQGLVIGLDGRMNWSRNKWIAAAEITSAEPVARGQWHDASISYDGELMRMELDGVLCGEREDSFGWVNTGYPFLIGQAVVTNYASNRFGFYGWIDRLQILVDDNLLYTRAEVSTPRPVDAAVVVSAPVPTFSTRRAAPLQLARDVEHGGPGTIYGTTKTKGSPANLPTKARVVLLHQRSKVPVREVWSDPVTGYFEFKGIDTAQQFIVLAEDADGNFRPLAANRLTPEVL